MEFVGKAWKVAPSDLTFLYEECTRCFWNKCAGGLPRPRAPFPRVFTVLDGLTKEFFRGKRTEQVAPGLPPGIVVLGDKWVRSGALHVPGHRKPVFITGRFDSVIQFDDGGYAVIDFKTTTAKDSHLAVYSRQLHCYAAALENAAPGNLALKPVTRLGLLCVEPVAMIKVTDGVAYKAHATWVEIERDDQGFIRFLSEVLDLLELPSPPQADPRCQFCMYQADTVLSLLAQVQTEEVSAR